MSTIWYYTPAAILALILLRKYQEFKWGRCINNVSLKGKIVVITGANCGIGFQVAKELAKRGAKVILACRDISKAVNAAKNITDIVGEEADLVPMELDLASLQSVKLFADQLNKSVSKIDILVNNAGVSYPKSKYCTTVDGFEIHLGVNHIGHFLLTKLLLPQLKVATPCRVIIVSSSLHQKGNIYLDDLNNEVDRDKKSPAYNNSKLMNAYFAKELARRNKEFKINTYAVCPGWVYTGLFRNYNVKWYHYLVVAPIALLFMRSPELGAQTVIYCATEPKLEEETGLFYRNCEQFKSKVDFDPTTALQLWDATEKMIEEKLKLL